MNVDMVSEYTCEQQRARWSPNRTGNSAENIGVGLFFVWHQSAATSPSLYRKQIGKDSANHKPFSRRNQKTPIFCTHLVNCHIIHKTTYTRFPDILPTAILLINHYSTPPGPIEKRTCPEPGHLADIIQSPFPRTSQSRPVLGGVKGGGGWGAAVYSSCMHACRQKTTRRVRQRDMPADRKTKELANVTCLQTEKH